MITDLLSPQLSCKSSVFNEWKIQHQDYRKHKGNHRNNKYVHPLIETICRDVFTTFWNISLKALYALISHLRATQMPIPKQHGNYSHAPSNQIPKEVITDVEVYLLSLKEEEGEAIATCPYKQKLTNRRITIYIELESIFYLPSHLWHQQKNILPQVGCCCVLTLMVATLRLVPPLRCVRPVIGHHTRLRPETRYHIRLCPVCPDCIWRLGNTAPAILLDATKLLFLWCIQTHISTLSHIMITPD